MKKNIPLMKVFMSPREELMPALEKILYSGMITEGEAVIQFEEALATTFGFDACPLSVNTGTAALQIAYRCSDVKGKIVLATPMTCTATNMPILHEGGKIVWVDIDSRTGNICIEDLKLKLGQYGSDIAAVSFVDFAGYPARLKEIYKLVKEANPKIKVIEDAAQALGARYNRHYIGNKYSDFTAFSFQAIKHLTTVDGGALMVNSKDRDSWLKAKKLKWYGINREAVKEATRWHYDIEDAGYKAHMNNVNATIGITQLRHIYNIITAHKANGAWFDQNLKNIPGVELLKIPKRSEPSYWIYMIKVKNRDDFAKMMLDAGINVNVAHIRNDTYSCFAKSDMVINSYESRPGLEKFNNEYIAIPCGWWVTPEDREYIAETIGRGW